MSNHDRINERPDPNSWGMDELMSLNEAAKLFWPAGPLTVNSLRIAVRDGVLPVTLVAGKILTSRRAIGEMSVCKPAGVKDVPAPGAVSDAALTAFKAKLALARDNRRRRE